MAFACVVRDSLFSINRRIERQVFSFVWNRYMSDEHNHRKYYESLFGNREQVGFGRNGQPGYNDCVVFPFPSLRYKEDTAEIRALREKEKGDWRLLRVDEKKSLYRSEYCQTFSEFTYIGNDWQGIIGWVLIHISVALWLFMLLHSFGPPLPPSFKPSAVREEMRQIINMQANPITGISSKWDYEKKDWKNPGFFTPPNPFKD